LGIKVILMKKTALFLLFFSMVVVALCQPGIPVGHLTIFSEDGDRFQLYLNGELMNDVPQVNLRVEDLRQPYYNARIVFEDRSRVDLTKNNLMIADADGTFADVTYKIKRDKNLSSKMKLNYFSSTPVVPDFIPPTNVHVVHFGQPSIPGTRGVTQTTTTTTTQGATIGASVQVGGVNMGVVIADPEMNAVTTTTTTTTSSSTGGAVVGSGTSGQLLCPARMAMSSANFGNALATVRNQSFDENKLSTARQIATSNCLSVNQISQLASLLSFEDNKLEFAKFAYDRCVDPGNYFNLNNIFSFSSSVESLNQYISGRR
jgi:hypothetical protein